MGILLQGFFFAPGNIAGVMSGFYGDKTIPFWWVRHAAQAHALRDACFPAIWLLRQQKCASGSFSTIYIDLVGNQRDGDNGPFNAASVDSLKNAGKGRFGKRPGDFHPHLTEDPGVFTAAFRFRRDQSGSD